MQTTPADSTEQTAVTHEPKRPSVSLTTTVFLIAVISLAVLFTFWLHQGSPQCRPQCQNNLRQIALALLMYEDKHHCFPAAGSTQKDGQQPQSWRVAILPYLGQPDLYEQYDPKEPWNSLKNQAIAASMPSVYHCPSDSSASGQETSYVMIMGRGTVGGLSDEKRGADFINSHSGNAVTLLAVEVPASKVHWMEPRDLTIDEVVKQLKNEKVETHPGVFFVAFCDGHVQILRDDIPPEDLRALANPERRWMDVPD
jgi:prepilin-type processing-associated H-X9-DG protein